MQVAGYLGNCAGYDCHLFVDKAGWTESTRVLELTKPGGPLPDPPPSIGIGGENEAFDRKAAPLQNSYVVISGRVDKDSCDGRGGTDRSSGINPTDIRAWTPAEGAPANTH